MVIFFIVVVLISWLILCYFKLKKWVGRFTKCNKLVVATVIDVIEKKAKSSHVPIYKPIFLVYDGDEKLIINSAYFSQYKYNLGDKISLYIDPNDCNRFMYADKYITNKALILDIFCCLMPLIFLGSVLLSL